MPEGPSTIRLPLGLSVATLFLPALVITEPPAVVIWVPTLTVEAPGAAEMTCPAMVVIMV